MTRYGFDCMIQSGLATASKLQATHDIIPSPRASSIVRFGSGVCLIKSGSSTMHVIIGDVEGKMAWIRLGLSPIFNTSVFGKNILGKRVGDTVQSDCGLTYLITRIFQPDTSGNNYHEPPLRIRCIA